MKAFALIALVAFQTACSGGGSRANAQPVPVQKPSQTVVPCPAGAPTAQCQSFLLTLTGKNGQAPAANVQSAVATAIAQVVGQLKAQYFMYVNLPTGFQACIDPAPNGGYDAIVYELNTFSVGNDAIWEIQTVKSCTGGR